MPLPFCCPTTPPFRSQKLQGELRYDGTPLRDDAGTGPVGHDTHSSKQATDHAADHADKQHRQDQSSLPQVTHRTSIPAARNPPRHRHVGLLFARGLAYLIERKAHEGSAAVTPVPLLRTRYGLGLMVLLTLVNPRVSATLSDSRARSNYDSTAALTKGCVMTFAAILIPKHIRTCLVKYLPKALMTRYAKFTILQQPDRLFFSRRIIPVLLDHKFSKVLSIGVDYYNVHMHRELSRRNIELWTIDRDPAKARWGSPERHVTGDVAELMRYFAPYSFDAVIFNGVLGFGVNNTTAADRALREIASMLRPNGCLVLGWNKDKFANVLSLAAVGELFKPFPGLQDIDHIEFQENLHTYNFYQRV
jgi:hypothetical protein